MTISEAAIKRGPSGFLKPQHRHVVSVVGKGVVYDGFNKREAQRTIHRWLSFGREVTFTRDGQPQKI